MRMARKLTYEEVKLYIENNGYKLLSKEYVNANEKLLLKCNKGHEYKASYSKFKNGRRCPYCSNRVKITREDVQKHLYSEGYMLLSEFKNSNIPMIVQCPNGHEWKVAYQKFKNGRRCSKCSGRYRTYGGHVNWDTELVKEFLEKESYKMISRKYTNSHSKITVECDKGHIVEITWSHFYRGVRCRICAQERSSARQRRSNKEVDKILESEGYKRLGDYINNNSSLEVRCKEGHVTTITLSNFTRGVRCKYCYASSGEKEVMRVLDDLELDYEKEYAFMNEETNTYMYFDFVIFDKERNIDFIIEFDGHHHFEERSIFDTDLETYQERDRIKSRHCENNNHSLIRIPHFEVSRANEIIINYIQNGVIEEFDVYDYLKFI